MGTLLIDKDELLAHSTDDGNTLTEISGAVMQKKLWSDVIGETIDAAHETESAFFFARAEDGSVAESGGLQTITSTAVNYRSKGFKTAAIFNNGVFSIDLEHTSGSTVARDWGIQLYIDDNNFFLWDYYYPLGRIIWIAKVGGVQTLGFSAIGSQTAIQLRLSRSGDDFTCEYNIGAGWVNYAEVTKAIGANTRLRWGTSAGSGAGVATVTANNLVITGSGIYWDTKGDGSAIKDTYNEQDVGAGSIIYFGTAVFTEDANMLYDYKIGSAVRVYGKTSAQIIALGNKVTDTGKFKLWAAYQGSTALASWTSISATWVSAVNKTGPFGNLNRLQRHIA